MSIRVGMRAMGRALGKIAARVPVLIFSDDFDWKDEMGFWKVMGEDFDWKEEWSGSLLFSEDFSGWAKK